MTDPQSPLTVAGGDGDDTLFGGGALDCGPGEDRVWDPRPSAVVATPACERVVGGSFTALELRRSGRTLRLRARGMLYVEAWQCGGFATIRAAAGGRVLARRFMRMPEQVLVPFELAARRALPARLRIELKGGCCPPGKRPTSVQPPDDVGGSRQSLLRFSIVFGRATG